VEKKIPAALNHLELVHVPVGSDSFSLIGQAEGEAADGEAVSALSLLEGWTQLYRRYFPVQPSDAEQVVDLNEVKLAAEAQVDSAVAVKDEELKRRKRELDLQRKMQLADAAGKRK
jgi:hypothetical protein